MKKCFELTPCLLAFLCITSCVEDVENERSKGMFSASQSGFSTIEVYDLGPLNKIDLSIAKAGLEDAGGTVTFSVEQSQYLLDFAKERNLLISGGADYHGLNKKQHELGIGSGNLNINNDIISNWTISCY